MTKRLLQAPEDTFEDMIEEYQLIIEKCWHFGDGDGGYVLERIREIVASVRADREAES